MFQRVTISAKIFGIAVGLVLIGAVVAAIGARMANVVSEQLRIVTMNYLPAYAALSNAAGAAGDESLMIHRLVTDAGEDALAPAARDHLVAEIKRQGTLLDGSVADARRLINRQIADPFAFDDDVALARLDTRLAFLQEDRASFKALLPKVIDATMAGRRDALVALLPQVEAYRDRFDTRIDADRNEMQRLSQAAAEIVRANQARTAYLGGLLMAIAAALGLVMAAIVTAGLVRPVRRLLAGTTAVEGGALDVMLPVTSRDEIGRLTAAFNRMVGELRVKERIRTTFGKYVDPRIVEGLIDRPDLNRADGERRVMTVLFCDMQGFTALSEGLTPPALVNVINRYLTLISDPVRAHGGIIDKYIGDAVMAFWGPPFCRPEEQAGLACAAALDQLAAARALAAELPELLGVKRNLPEIAVRIGIATGEAVVGDIGSDVAKSYTVMGDTVNLASRLEGANKVYGSRILINEDAARMAGDAVELRELDSIRVVGKTEPERVFEVLGAKGQVPADTLMRRDLFAEGLDAYRRGKWAEAKAAFARCLEGDAADPAARTFLERVERLAAEPPREAWTGVWSLVGK